MPHITPDSPMFGESGGGKGYYFGWQDMQRMGCLKNDQSGGSKQQ